jgi:hypothetical protein
MMMNMRGRCWIFMVLLCLGGTLPTTQPSSVFPPLDDPSLPNAHVVSSKVICGGQPEGDAGFEKLAALGVKTIISVDGISPNVEAAHRHGIHYVHLPFGYDGVPDSAAKKSPKRLPNSPAPSTSTATTANTAPPPPSRSRA